MKMSVLTSPIGIAAALGFVTMAAVGWQRENHRATAVVPSEPSPAASSSRPGRPARHTGPPEDVVRRMNAIRNAATPAERTRATIALANSLSVSEIGSWLDSGWFNVRGGPDIMIFTLIIKDRWEAADPASFVRWSMKTQPENTGSGIAGWATKDRAGALAYLSEQPGDSKTMQALADLAKKDPGLAAEAYRSLVARGLATDRVSYSSDFMRELAKKDPTLLEGMLDSLPASVRRQAESSLSGARLVTSFATEIRSLWDQPDGWRKFQDNAYQDRTIAQNLFAELGNMPPSWRHSFAESSFGMTSNDPERWFNTDYASLGFAEADAGRIRSSAIISLVHSDNEKAITLLNSGVIPQDQLENTISNFFSNLSGDPEKARELASKLGTEQERQMASAVIDRSTQQQQNQKISTPAEWIEQVSAIDKDSSNGYQFTSALRQWTPEAMEQLGTQFQNLPDEAKKNVASVLVNNWSSNSVSPIRGDAISYLISHPDTSPLPPGRYDQRGERSASMASNYAAQLAVQDPEAASAWVQSLPAGDAQSWAQKNLAAVWSQYDPDATASWLQSLPAANRTAVQDFVKYGVKR